MYQDIYLKEQYYQEEIKKNLIRQGLNTENVDERLSRINSYLSIFKAAEVSDGQLFNTEQYNLMMHQLEADLIILHRLLDEAFFERFKRFKMQAQSRMFELKEEYELYKNRYRYEAESNHLGKTVYYQSGNFLLKEEAGKLFLTLPPFKVTPGKKLSLLAKTKTLPPNKISGEFIQDDISFFLPCYKHQKIGRAFPRTAELSYLSYDLEEIPITEDQYVELAPEELATIYQDQYRVYNGKDYIQTYYPSTRTTAHTPFTGEVYLEEGGQTQFYLVDADTLRITFNKKPTYVNIPTEDLENPERNPLHIIIEHPDAFSFRVETNGTLYRHRENGILFDNRLLYPKRSLESNDFLIEIMPFESPKETSGTVIFNTSQLSAEDIEYIALKER